MNHSIKDSLKLWHIDGQYLVFSDGSLGSGFKLTGYDISCKSPDEINQFGAGFENLLVTLPENYSLQFFYKLSPDVSELIEKHKEVSKDCIDLYQPIRDARISYLLRNELDKNYFVPELYCFIKSPTHRFRKRKFFEKSQNYSQLTRTEFDTHKSKFERALNQIESGLSGLKLLPLRLSPKDWFELSFSYLNFSRSESVGTPDLRNNFDQTLVDQLVLSDINVERDAIHIGDKQFRVITLGVLPERATFSAMIDALRSCRFISGFVRI